ncbi:MAG: hypothetical protein IJX63_14610 [Lachnospiraceae bacterium]|nr:hypothetical protein [Lachnospiraceae bacterium]
MLGSLKKILVAGGVVLSMVLTGCGGKEGEEIPQKVEQEFYYALEEKTLPDSRKTLTAPEGGRVDVFDPFLIGARVFRCASENTLDYQSKGFYLQYLQTLGVDRPECHGRCFPLHRMATLSVNCMVWRQVNRAKSTYW